MTETEVAALLRDCMVVTLKVGGVPLMAALVVGLGMSILQAITQINEQTLVFIPKVVAIGGSLMLLGTFMLGTLSDFATAMFDRLIAIGSQ